MASQTSRLNMTQLNTVAATCACVNIRKASRVVTQLYDEALQPSGLLANQFTLLVALSLVDSATMTRLAQDLVMDRTTLTRNVKPLEKQGLISITPGEDQRTRMLSLTDAGRTTLAKALPLWEQVQTRVVGELGQERWQLLLAGLSDTVSLVSQA